MKTAEFLKQVTDSGGYLRVLALDVLEGMSNEDFEELCGEIQSLRDIIVGMAQGDSIALTAALLKFPEIFE